MTEAILQFFQGIPDAWTTMIIAALPVIEVRGAVPIALELLDMPIASGMFFAFLGSAIPAVLLPVILEPLEKPVRKWIPFMDRLFDWVVQHVEKRYTDKYRARGAIGLIIFIAIPLPVTGVWTGSLAAWLFHIPKRYAIPAITIGTAISTLIVTFTTVSGFAFLRAVL